MEITVHSWPQAITLVDCDSFYVSCEVVLNPKLIGNPVCVLSNNDGCVISRSKEAKALGIKMGEPAYAAKKRVPQAIYLSSNYYLYDQTSKKIMTILGEFTPEVEVYSIDEAFLDLSGLRQVFKKPYIEIAKDIREQILKRTGIPVSIGVSLSKTLAKIAVRIAKKDEGIYSISGKQLREILPKIKVEDIWQIGNNTAKLLSKFGINTAFDFACQDEKWIEKTLTKKGLELLGEICGYSVWKVNPEKEEIKGIQRTKSFATCVKDKEILKGSLHYHLHRAFSELRAKNLKASLLTIMLRRKDFQSVSLSCVVNPPSNFEFDFTNKINMLFEKIYEPNFFYRSSGVHLTNLVSVDAHQLNLFSNLKSTLKKESLGNTWDNIEKQFGKQVLKTASMPTLKQRVWDFTNLPEVH